MSVIPFLLFNSSVWGDIPKKGIDILENLQNTFYRCLLATPRSTPIPALLWETGGLTMACRVNLRKLTFYHHLMSLDGSAVASRVANLAMKAGYPGLMHEYKELCTQYNLPCARDMSKQRWKKLVKTVILDANKKHLLGLIRSNYTKLDYHTLEKEEFEIKNYLKELRLSNARLMFKIRSKMVENIAFNFSNDPKHIERLWKCTHCDNMDSQSHVLFCASYKHLREGKDLANNHDLVAYFRDVISLRDKLVGIV